MKAMLLAAALATPAPAENAPPAAGKARLPGFASALSARPPIDGPDGWRKLSDADAWAAIARAAPAQRQAARWTYALSLVGQGRAAEALGVLDVMLLDDPDLMLVSAFRLARGAALTQLRRPAQAIAELSFPGLARNAEACLWRMAASAAARLPDQALSEMACAVPAINARPFAARAPFVLIAAGQALRAGRPEVALTWLRPFPPANAAASLLRGKAFAAMGRGDAARREFARAGRSAKLDERLDAELGELELAAASNAIDRKAAIRKLERIRFAWRGDDIEARALRLSVRLADETGDVRGALTAGSTLLRYLDIGSEAAPLLARLQAQLAAALDPGNGLPLEQSVAVYWDFRDLAPMGAQGDQLVSRLGERLQSAGLYARAAELLEHQLFARAKDLAQGPLSVRVAALHILSARPDRALNAVRRTEGNRYPDAMLWDRRRIEAVALAQLGKPTEALDLLDDVPGSAALRADIHWRMEDWSGFARASWPALPAAQNLSEVDQAMILRQAVALAMLRSEAGLGALRQRYGTAFATLASGPAFAALTGDVAGFNSESILQAMAAIPSASPAGALGDLLEAGVGARH